jgi:hypothetical protein
MVDARVHVANDHIDVRHGQPFGIRDCAGERSGCRLTEGKANKTRDQEEHEKSS